MNLTPQQIDMLPEAQRQQVRDLQRQLVRSITQYHLCHSHCCGYISYANSQDLETLLSF